MTRNSPNESRPVERNAALDAFGFDDPAETWLHRVREAERADGLGSVGRYELLEEISRGGQGIVFKARQLDSGRLIALKRLLAGSFSTASMRRRFERELEATAGLDHPNIVAVTGLETADGVPLLSMEWVDGAPITAWARGKPLAELLAVFAGACDGVHHAHQHGVLHRDVKPSNVLVDRDGRARILDFGMARIDGDGDAAAGLTRSGDLVGTPAYASPEQVRGGAPLDVRSDVYSLGVVLYEMLCGRSPYGERRGVRDLLDAVERAEPPRPSARVPALSRDVDAVVSKALAKRPDQRYGSAAELAADVRRCIAGEPVAARSPGACERARRLVARNRFAFGIAALVLAFVVAFAASAVVNARRVARERDTAIAATRRAEAILSFFLDNVVAAFDPNDPGRVPDLAHLVDRLGATVSERFGGDPALESAVLRTAGDLCESLGDFARAEAFLRRAVALSDAAPRDEAAAAVACRLSLSRVLIQMQRLDEAEPLLRETLALFESHPGLDRSMLASVHGDLGVLALERDALDEAETHARKAVELAAEANGPDHPQVAVEMANLSQVLANQWRLDEAEELLRTADERLRRAFHPRHPSLASVRNRLGQIVALRGGDDARAEALYREGIAMIEDALGAEHPDVGNHRWELALLLATLGRHQEAIDEMRTVQRLWSAARPPDHPSMQEIETFLAAQEEALRAANGH